MEGTPVYLNLPAGSAERPCRGSVMLEVSLAAGAGDLQGIRFGSVRNADVTGVISVPAKSEKPYSAQLIAVHT